MALPIIVTPAVPQASDSPGNAPAIFASLWTLFLDIFGMPANTPITGNLMTLGSNTDGKVATIPVVKNTTPFLRLVGTEVSGVDMRIIESGGNWLFQLNTGTEGAPTWVTVWVFAMAGLTHFAQFIQANTVDRAYTLPDKNGTIALLDDAGGFPTGTVLLFMQAMAPTGWTRVVNAGLTDSVIRVLMNSEVPSSGGSWTISGLTFAGSAMASHAHETPFAFNADTPGSTFLEDNLFGLGTLESFGAGSAGAAGGPISAHTLKTSAVSAGTPAGTIASDATWRPKYVDVIACSKN